MTFRMRVEDLFRVGEKTIFTGALETQREAIAAVPCVIEIDGRPVGELRIEGEMRTGRPPRDLWTQTPVDLSRETLRDHDVWLIAKEPH